MDGQPVAGFGELPQACGFVDVVAAGFAAGFAADAAGFFAVVAAGAVCARIPGVASSVIPTSNVIKGRIVCSFPLNFSPPVWQRWQ